MPSFFIHRSVVVARLMPMDIALHRRASPAPRCSRTRLPGMQAWVVLRLWWLSLRARIKGQPSCSCKLFLVILDAHTNTRLIYSLSFGYILI